MPFSKITIVLQIDISFRDSVHLKIHISNEENYRIILIRNLLTCIILVLKTFIDCIGTVMVVSCS